MSRPIKFRAWDKFTKKMWEWDDHNAFTTGRGSIKQWFTDSDLIQLQFTGLLDKNGVEIYEGDIVEVSENVKTHGQVQDDGNTLWNVVDQGLRFEVAWNSMTPCFELYPTKNSEDVDIETARLWIWNSDGGSECLKVIGNIYKNPKLVG